jgi:phosphomannomutase
VAIADYEKGTEIDLRTGIGRPLALPPSDVLAFRLATGARVVARPSGTEPKAKIYVDAAEEVRPSEPVREAEARAAARMRRLCEAFLKHFAGA